MGYCPLWVPCIVECWSSGVYLTGLYYFWHGIWEAWDGSAVIPCWTIHRVLTPSKINHEKCEHFTNIWFYSKDDKMGVWEDAVMGMYHSPYKFEFTPSWKCLPKNVDVKTLPGMGHINRAHQCCNLLKKPPWPAGVFCQRWWYLEFTARNFSNFSRLIIYALFWCWQVNLKGHDGKVTAINWSKDDQVWPLPQFFPFPLCKNGGKLIKLD